MKTADSAAHESVGTLLSEETCSHAKKALLQSCWNLESH